MSATAHLSIRKRTKTDACEKFIQGLRERGDINVDRPGFVDSIREHFKLLPTRYALDVNIEGLEVLNHKRLLEEARENSESVAFQVRPVEVYLPKLRESNGTDSSPSQHESPLEAAVHLQTRRSGSYPALFARPAFASSPNLQALLLDSIEHDNSSEDGTETGELESLMFYEITVAAKDQPKLLSKLSKALSDANLNIREAHVFNTYDKFSLDVFVVDGWVGEVKDGLEESLKIQFRKLLHDSGASASTDAAGVAVPEEGEGVILKQEGRRDDWEIDVSNLQIISRIAAGTFGNLYKGMYYGQEVAVKVIKDVHENAQQYQEFMQEVAIMRKIRHKNVIQFIGACTVKPNLCIIFEYMANGSVHDYIRKEGQLRVSEVLKIAIDVVRGMDYLHRMNIIHRDLKAANLLLDENNSVKIGDFGVSRIVEQNTCMTAETGTYRWMAPEVIEHNPYDHKADVFSFGVLLWELLTCQVPYSGMTPLQAAVGVVQKGLRPEIPPHCPPRLAQLMRACWNQHPANRPSFHEMQPRVQELFEEERENDARSSSAQSRSSRGLLSRLRNK